MPPGNRSHLRHGSRDGVSSRWRCARMHGVSAAHPDTKICGFTVFTCADRAHAQCHDVLTTVLGAGLVPAELACEGQAGAPRCSVPAR